MEKFLLRPVTKSLFMTEYFLPLSRDFDTATCLEILEPPPPSVVRTTSWIASRLSGVDAGARPPAHSSSNSENQTVEEGDTQRRTGEYLIKSLYRKWERHAVIFNYIISQEVTLGTPSKERVNHSARLIDARSACASHLFEKTVSRNRKGVVGECYLRIPFQTDRYDSIFSRIDVFPRWEEIKVTTRIERTSASIVSRDDDDDVPTKRDDPVVDTTEEVANVAELEEWSREGKDRRNEQLADYIAFIYAKGYPFSGHPGIYSVPRTYRRKEGHGRAYCGHLSLQQVTRESRRRALSGLPWNVYEMDQENSQPCLLREFLRSKGCYSDIQFPLLNSYCAEPETWRIAIAEYYGFDKQRAKKIILCALFSGRYVPFEGADILPCVRGLSDEFLNAIQTLSTINEFAEVSNLQKVLSHRNPAYSALSIFLGGLEHMCTAFMREP